MHAQLKNTIMMGTSNLDSQDLTLVNIKRSPVINSLLILPFLNFLKIFTIFLHRV